jgi:UDP-glucuronate 4-epimerase
MRILVTGNAGFIGFHTAKALLERNDEVIGIDVVNDYYDTGIKEARLGILQETANSTGSGYIFIRSNLADTQAVSRSFAEHKPDRVIHLAAQAGVRHSLKNPHAYVESNLTAFTNILEACRYHATPHLTFASTSSVYGANTRMPFSEHDAADHPLQFYAATKRANELMAHAYSSLFRLPTTGLRFFTVYGPWGRPDMALFLITGNIIQGDPIKVFNYGNHTRDFTYIDDIVEGVIRASDQIAAPAASWRSDQPDPSCSSAPFRILNIGSGSPITLMHLIEAAEAAIGKTADKVFLPLQTGDVPDTLADTTELMRAVGYRPSTSITAGVKRFVDWYRSYYGV